MSCGCRGIPRRVAAAVGPVKVVGLNGDCAIPGGDGLCATYPTTQAANHAAADAGLPPGGWRVIPVA